MTNLIGGPFQETCSLILGEPAAPPFPPFPPISFLCVTTKKPSESSSTIVIVR